MLCPSCSWPLRRDTCDQCGASLADNDATEESLAIPGLNPKGGEVSPPAYSEPWRDQLATARERIATARKRKTRNRKERP